MTRTSALIRLSHYKRTWLYEPNAEIGRYICPMICRKAAVTELEDRIEAAEQGQQPLYILNELIEEVKNVRENSNNRSWEMFFEEVEMELKYLKLILKED